MTANKIQQYSLGFIACLFLIMTYQVHGAWAPHNNNNQQGNYLREDFLDGLYWSNVDEYQCNDTSQQGNNLWLFVGNTGAGKSTTINYGLGHTLMEVTLKDIATGKVKPVGISAKDAWNADKKVIVVKKEHEGREIAKIGINQVSACTSMPKVYTTAPGSVGLVDCPGFGDTRGTEQRVFNMFAIRNLVEQASNIQAIVYIISYPEVESRRGEVFVEVIKQLDSLLGGAMPYMTSIHFFFTKIRNGIDKQYIINTIKGIKAEKENFYQRICKNYKDAANKIWGKKKESTILKIVNCLLECNNIHIINPLDGGKSWEEAKVYINKNAINYPFIPKEAFTMEIPNVDVQGILASVYDDEAGRLLKFIGGFYSLTKKIKRNTCRIQEIKSLMGINKSKKSSNKSKQEETRSKSIDDLVYEKTVLEVLIKSLAGDEKLVEYRKLEVQLDNWFLAQEKYIEYNDLPYVRIDKSGLKNCKEDIKFEHKQKGRYKASYYKPINWKNIITAASMGTYGGSSEKCGDNVGKKKSVIRHVFWVKKSVLNASEIKRRKNRLKEVEIDLFNFGKLEIHEIKKNLELLQKELEATKEALIETKNKNRMQHFYQHKVVINRLFMRGQIGALLEVLDTYYAKEQKEKNNQIQKPMLEKDDEKKDDTQTLSEFLVEHKLGFLCNKLNEVGDFNNDLQDFLALDNSELAELCKEVGIKACRKELLDIHQAARWAYQQNLQAQKDHTLKKLTRAKRKLLVHGYCRTYDIPKKVGLLIVYFVYDNPLKYKSKTLTDDLSGQDLSGFDFTGCHFTHTNLTNVILTNTTCDYQKAFLDNIKRNKIATYSGKWYQENLPKDLKSIAQVYPKLNNNTHKAKLLQVASAFSQLPFYEYTEFYIKVAYWSSELVQLKQALGKPYVQQLICSLQSGLEYDANNCCWTTNYPQGKLNIEGKVPHANFDTYLKDFTNGLTKYQCKSEKIWGFDYYKEEITKNIEGLAATYPHIKEKQLQQEARDIAHALSKSYQSQKGTFQHHYLFFQNRLIRLKKSVGVGVKNKIHYNSVLYGYSFCWRRGKK